MVVFGGLVCPAFWSVQVTEIVVHSFICFCLQIIEDILVRCCLITTISRGRDITQIQQVISLISRSNSYFYSASWCLLGSGINFSDPYQIEAFLRFINKHAILFRGKSSNFSIK